MLYAAGIHYTEHQMKDKLAGEIRADCAYTVREFCRRTGLGHQHVHRTLKARWMARRRFILGRDFIDALMASVNPYEQSEGSNDGPDSRIGSPDSNTEPR